MAVTASLRKLMGYLDLNNGVTPSGAVKTLSLNICGGTTQQLNITTFTDDPSDTREGVVAIASALSPALSKSMYGLREVDTYNLQIS